MKRLTFIICSLSLFFVYTNAQNEEKLNAIQQHNRAVHIKDGWIRDPYIYLAPDEYYYLTGTSPLPGNPAEYDDKYNIGMTFISEKLGLNLSIVGHKIRVWRSSDLVNWNYAGEPFSLETGYWSQIYPEAFENPEKKEWLVWAPEMFYDNGTWIFVHTSPEPVAGGANLIVKKDITGNETPLFPMGEDMRYKHDPSLFKDDDGTWYLLWENTFIAPLKPGFSGLAAAPVRIDPSDRIIGHEGATLRKIGNKYVLFGTAWSTDKPRKGSYNLYYCTADSIYGPYSERRFAGRFLGHGTPFRDKTGNWWCTAFFNANIPPVDSSGIESEDLSNDAQTINEAGTTIVPLDVKILDDGDVYIRAIDSRYALPGPDENQQFEK